MTPKTFLDILNQMEREAVEQLGSAAQAITAGYAPNTDTIRRHQGMKHAIRRIRRVLDHEAIAEPDTFLLRCATNNVDSTHGSGPFEAIAYLRLYNEYAACV